jgi:hypothetical protein
MLPVLLLVVTTLVAQSSSPTFERRTFKAPDGTAMRYGLSLPATYDKSRPRPLVPQHGLSVASARAHDGQRAIASMIFASSCRSSG